MAMEKAIDTENGILNYRKWESKQQELWRNQAKAWGELTSALCDLPRITKTLKDVQTQEPAFKVIQAFMAELPNVSLNFGPVEDENAHPLEQVYLSNIFKNLS